MFERTFKGRFQLFQAVDPCHPFTSCRIRRLYYHRPRIPIAFGQSLLYGRKAFCFRNIKSMLCQEITELVLILQNTNRFIRTECRQPHLFLNISGCNNPRINGKRHDSVYLESASQGKYGFLVYNTYIIIFV